VRLRSPNVLPFFLPVIGLVALRSPATAVTIKLMESLPRVNVSAGGGVRLQCCTSSFTDCTITLQPKDTNKVFTFLLTE